MSFYNKMRRQKFLSFTVMLFTLSVAILIGALAQTNVHAAKETTAAPDATPLTIPNAAPMENEFTKVAKELEPSVVNISGRLHLARRLPGKAKAACRAAASRQQAADSTTMTIRAVCPICSSASSAGRWRSPGRQPQDQRSESLGSGVVVDRNGYILTNNHVVEKATTIKVKFMNDATDYPATVIGTDKDTDLAIIHVDRKGLAAARIGNSDAMQPGDWSIAIGSPFGFQATVTAGIISAISRDIPGDGSSFQHFIQTDAAINPGNSGGPLANINGEVIGINTMIASRSGGYQGIGFAMPINTAVKVYNQIIKAGHMTRGSIGIKFQPPNDALLKVYGADHGIFVETVVPNGPAEKAGMKEQDILTSIDGKAVTKGQDLIDMVADSALGSTLKIGVIRDKKPLMLSVVVADRVKLFADDGALSSTEEPGAEPNTSQMKFGMSVQDLRTVDRQNMGYKGSSGVLIASIEPGSFADDIGLAKGDVIVELNREKVNTKEDIRRIQGTLKPGQAVAFQVMRQAQGPRGAGGEWQPIFAAGVVPANQ